VGGTARVSEVDTLNVRYSHAQIDFTPTSFSTSSATSSHFLIDSATIGLTRILTPYLTAEVGGGGIWVNPRLTTYAANAALIMNFQNNSATISYSHSAFPSYASVPIILVGDVFSLSAVQKIDRQWQLAESASYVHTSGGGGLNALTYDSFVVGGDIQYWVTSIWSTSLSYSYSKFTNESGSVKTDFDRQVITLSVRATWG
jgi:hypothetical protein